MKENRKTGLFLFDGLKNFNDTFLVIGCMNSFKNLAVFSSAHLPYHLIVILLPNPAQSKINQSTSYKLIKKELPSRHIKTIKISTLSQISYPHWTVRDS